MPAPATRGFYLAPIKLRRDGGVGVILTRRRRWCSRTLVRPAFAFVDGIRLWLPIVRLLHPAPAEQYGREFGHSRRRDLKRLKLCPSIAAFAEEIIASSS